MDILSPTWQKLNSTSTLPPKLELIKREKLALDMCGSKCQAFLQINSILENAAEVRSQVGTLIPHSELDSYLPNHKHIRMQASPCGPIPVKARLQVAKRHTLQQYLRRGVGRGLNNTCPGVSPNFSVRKIIPPSLEMFTLGDSEARSISLLDIYPQ